MKILSINYSILKSGFGKKFSSVFVYKSNLTLSFLGVLFREGLIYNYNISDSNKIEVFLKYYKGFSVIHDIIPVSSGSRLIYYSVEDICYWKNFYSSIHSFLILNTSKQVFSSNELKINIFIVKSIYVIIVLKQVEVVELFHFFEFREC
jgi:ribosomal protein S8